MHTEHLHRTLSVQAYAHLQDTLRQQAEEEHRLAVQAGFQALARQLLQLAQRMRHALTHNYAHTHPLKA